MAIGKVIGRVAIKVLPDTSEFREKTANDLRRIEKQLGNLEVDVIPTLDKGAKSKLKAELRAWAKEVAATIQVDLNLNKGDMALTAAELQALTRDRRVSIAPELDNGAVARVAAGLAAMSGLRSLRDMAARFRNELMNLDRAVPKIAVVSHAIAGLGAWVLGVSGNLFSLSSSLATMGKAGLALPGIFGGIAIGLATTIAALKDFNKQVPQASRYVKQLQDTISQNFWEKAAEPIRNLVDKLFPILNKALAETSTALGGFFANFANSTANLLLPALPGMFDSLTESIQVASKFTDQFVGIIEKLGTVGASYLPRLAAWVGDIATQFDNWLGSADLTGMIEQGITSIKQFGSATASLFSIFQSLGQAAQAAGGSTLESLSEGLYDIARAAESPGFQKGLTDTLRAAYDMMGQIADIAGPNMEQFIITMSERFQALGPTIGDTIGTAISAIAGALSSPAVTEGLTAMFEGFNQMVHSLAPAMEPLMEKFAALGKLIGAVAQNLGVVLAAAIESLAPIFATIAEALVPVINMLGPMLAGVIKALAPVFEALGSALGRAASALQPLFGAVQKLLDLLLPILVPVLKIVVQILGDALVAVIQGATWAIEGLVKIVSGVIDVFKGLWDMLAGLFTLDFGRMWDGLKQVFGGLGQILLGALQGALGAVWAYLNGTVLAFFKGFALKLVGPVAGPLGSFFKPIVDAAKRVIPIIGKVWDYIKTGIAYITGGGGGSALSRFGEVLAYPFQRIIPIVRTAFNVIKTVVSTGWKVISTIIGAAVKVIGTIVSTAFNVIRTVISTYITVWKTIISTAWNVIKTVFTTAFNVIKTVVSAGLGVIRGFIQTTMDGLYFLFKGPWDAITGFLMTAWTNIKVGFMLIWDSLRVWLDTLLTYWIVRFQLVWETIRAATAAVWNVIKTIFTTVWTAISTTVTTYLSAVKAVITTVWNAIKAATSAVWNAIKAVVKTVWTAIRSTVSSVANAVKTVVTNVWNAIKSSTSAVWSAIRSLISGAWSAIRGLVSGAVNAVRGSVSSAWNSIKSSTSSAWNSVKTTVSNAWNNVKTAVTNGVRDAIAQVKTLPSKAKSALAGIGSILINAGSDLIGGFIEGIKSKFDDVKGALSSLTDKLTSWKGPPKRDAVLLTPAGQLIIDSLIKGFEDRFRAVRSMLTDLTSEIAGFIGKTMSQQIADALSFAIDGNVGTAITAEASVQGVNLDRRLGGLERRITTSARSAAKEAKPSDKSTVEIGSITIPLDDLAQLKDLEEFLEMLRVRTRQG